MDGRENMIGRRIQSLFIKLLITVVDPRSGVFERPASCWQSSLAGAAEAAKLLVDSCQKACPGRSRPRQQDLRLYLC